LCPLAAEGPQELAVSDAVEPGPQRSLVLKAPQMPPGPDEGLLGQIFRQLRALGEPEQVAVDARVVLAKEAMAGLGIAVPELFHEPRVRGSTCTCFRVHLVAP